MPSRMISISSRRTTRGSTFTVKFFRGGSSLVSSVVTTSSIIATVKSRNMKRRRPVKEDDRTRHLTTCSAHAEPVFLTFKDDEAVNGLIEKDSAGDPMIDFEAEDGVRHTIWKVADAQAYVEAFSRLNAVYIADGHHRTAAGERAATQRQTENTGHTGNEEYNRVLSVMFPGRTARNPCLQPGRD